jgi:2-amino-4-hydroxy-6-hydroxymethyldihydropteridine diphosphokinase
VILGEFAFLGLGSNIGDRRSYLQSAAARIAAACGRVLRVSGLYDTEPWGSTRQRTFLNQVMEICTHHTPRELLHHCQQIESALMRRRIMRWGPRTIDIDILLFGDMRIRETGLTIPHPELSARRFVLVPLAELIPERIVPGSGRSVRDLLEHCQDTGRVTRLDL